MKGRWWLDTRDAFYARISHARLSDSLVAALREIDGIGEIDGLGDDDRSRALAFAIESTLHDIADGSSMIGVGDLARDAAPPRRRTMRMRERWAPARGRNEIVCEIVACFLLHYRNAFAGDARTVTCATEAVRLVLRDLDLDAGEGASRFERVDRVVRYAVRRMHIISDPDGTKYLRIR